jgi:uncharacterized membrane protein
MLYIIIGVVVILGVIRPFLKKRILKNITSEELFFISSILTGALSLLLFLHKNIKGDMSWNIFKKPFTYDLNYTLIFITIIITSFIANRLWPIIYASKLNVIHIINNIIPVEIILTALLGYYVFEEDISYHTIGGIILVVFGILIINYGHFKAKKK